MRTDPDLKKLLGDLDGAVAEELETNPDIIEAGDSLDLDDLYINARKWHRLDEVVAVVADLKGSTGLGYNKHPASTAAIYEASTGGLARILDTFDADYIAIQGDGAVGLFWGDQRFERALCAGITIKTFSAKHLVKRLEKKWDELPKTGFKVGVAASSVLVKKVGIPRTDHKEPVWVGKAVNYAAKAAQQADADEMIVTGTIWDFVENNDFLAATCSCDFGPSATLWQDVTIRKIHESDDEREGRVLTSMWCATHGSAFCHAVMIGETDRTEAEAVVKSLKTFSMSDSMRAVAYRRRRDRRAARLGLKKR
jgi:class 3 adenylate cyclase